MHDDEDFNDLDLLRPEPAIPIAPDFVVLDQQLVVDRKFAAALVYRYADRLEETCSAMASVRFVFEELLGYFRSKNIDVQPARVWRGTCRWFLKMDPDTGASWPAVEAAEPLTRELELHWRGTAHARKITYT